MPDYLNLAQVLEDGMKIQVPDREQAEEWKARGLTQSGISMGGGTAGVQTSGRTGSGEGGSKARVNLNTASREELMTSGESERPGQMTLSITARSLADLSPLRIL